MRSRFWTILLMLVFVIICPGPKATVLAGDQKTHSATIRLCVYWLPPPSPQAAYPYRQVKRHAERTLVSENKAPVGKRMKMKTLWKH